MNRDDIINKVFPHSLFGYDPVAVDAFLDEVIREFDRQNNTIDVLRLKLSQELGEAMDVNKMLSGELNREGLFKRVAELPPPEYGAPEAKEAMSGETDPAGETVSDNEPDPAEETPCGQESEPAGESHDAEEPPVVDPAQEEGSSPEAGDKAE